MKAVAKLRNCPTSPRKMRLVVNEIRGQKVDKALDILKHTRKVSAKRVEKLLLSAMSNWQNKNEGARIEDSELFVESVFVDSARQLKRFRPAPHGRAHRIRKRSNHITLVVDSKLNVESAISDAQVVEEKAPKKEKKQVAPKKEVKPTAAKKTTTKSATKKVEAKKVAKKEDKKDKE